MNPMHLLEQAERLATMGLGRPRQTDLRRAVSTAYYAIFHLLTLDAARRLSTRVALRRQIARAYNHGEMDKISRAFARGNLSPELQSLISTIPDDLRTVAQAFVELQEARHKADYDMRTIDFFDRLTARRFVQTAQTAFDAWNRVRTDAVAEVYLLALLLHGRWGR